MRCPSWILLALFALLLVPSAARAQASITGLVRDTSGAVLPGVTVEAASPALIEKIRSVVTDDTGQYRIVDLRPGTYSVTFSLPGFNTVQRPGIELTGSFVATLNADLRIGNVEETITVTGESPIVDVQSSTQQRSITADTIAAIPTGRSLVNLTILIPGMVAFSPRGISDVGGTDNLQNTFVSIHGGRPEDQRTSIDGISIRNILGTGNSTNFTPDIGSSQEVTVDYAAGAAEQISGGVRVNYIPREGGNIFSGSLFATGANSAFQGDNYSEDLKNRGLTTPNELKQTYDVNPTFGGPISRDKVWFYGAARFQNNQNYVAGMFENLNAGDPNAWTYVPSSDARGVFNIIQKSLNGRITYQATPRNKLTAFFEKQWREWDDGRQGVSPEAFVRYRFPTNQIGVVGWTSTITNRLLLEVRGSHHGEVWLNIGGDELMSNNRQLIPVTEQGGAIPGLSYRSLSGVYAKQSAPNIMQALSALSYVTGAHALKVGVDYLGGEHTNPNTATDSALQYRFNNTVPNLITEYATPYERAWRLTEVGLYAQDKWTLGKLTMNAGLRFDYYATTFPAAHLGPGTLVPNRDINFPETPFYRFKDLSPRLGASYDLFGDGRTALKVTANRYTNGLVPTDGHPVTNLASQVTRSWTDSDRDYVPDCNILNPLQNGECGTISDLTFGSTRPSTTYDPAILNGWNTRPANWEFSGSVQHQLIPRMGLNVGYFRRAYTNFTVTDNRATVATDYTSFGFTTPIDPRLPDGGGYPVSGYYNLNPNKVGQVDNLITAADSYGSQIEHWNGVDASVNLRLLSVRMQGGMSTGRTSTDNCDVAAQVPEILATLSIDQCHQDTKFLTQFKFLGSYTIPRIDVSVAGTVQSSPGVPITAAYVATNALVQPSLGRPLSGGAQNTTAAIIDPGTEYGERINQLDIRFAKLFRINTTRTSLNFDIYNALNANPVTILNRNYSGDGTAWLQPQGILPARLFKLGVQFDF
jgi:carboxypeptidase family protein